MHIMNNVYKSAIVNGKLQLPNELSLTREYDTIAVIHWKDDSFLLSRDGYLLQALMKSFEDLPAGERARIQRYLFSITSDVDLNEIGNYIIERLRLKNNSVPVLIEDKTDFLKINVTER